jgi:hypothetical protein
MSGISLRRNMVYVQERILCWLTHTAQTIYWLSRRAPDSVSPLSLQNPGYFPWGVLGLRWAGPVLCRLTDIEYIK